MSIAAAEVPVRADGLVLIGEMRGSGYREPPALARRADGQTVQLTPLLYAVLEEIRDDRTIDQVAAQVSERLDRTVTAKNVQTLIDQQLRPLGLLQRADGSDPELRRSNPLLGLRWRFTVTSPELTDRLTAPFVRLFNPVLIFLVTAGFVAIAWWVLLHKGLASATYEAFRHPALLVLIVAVMVLSAGFHEFGHAAATSRGGARPRAMGGGLYLVWPAFYTDVTDAYRLGRGGRLRTDLGGLYFDAMVVVAAFGVWAATRWDGWLLVVAAQVIGMTRQLTPLVRFDGYHILCDLTGVPDLYSRLGPILLGFLPKHWRSPQVTALKPWVRVVVSLWVIVVIPMLAFALFAIVVSFPRVAGTAWARIQEHAELLGEAASSSDIGGAAARVVAILALGLPVLAMALLVLRLAYGAGKRAWTRTRGRPVRRSIAGVLAALLVGGVAYAWWPTPDRYVPVQPWERGTLLDATPVAASWTVPSTVQAGYRAQTTMTMPRGSTMPTRDHPQLALVLVPRDTASDDKTWVFPFNRPLAPEEGDNQSLAVNYTDGGATYDVAFAMVWADDGSEVRNRNEAYALASCEDCTTVAVAFQVVVVVGQSNIVIPQNLAAAVNYNCLSCVTVALAQQLLVTVDRMPSDEAMTRIRQLWAALSAFSEHITEKSLEEIEATLDRFEADVLAVLKDDGVLSISPEEKTRATTSSPSPSADGSSNGPGDRPTDGPSATATAKTTQPPAPDSSSSRAPRRTPSSPAASPTKTSPSATKSAQPATPSP